MHHKRKRHKNRRAGCLLCKPHKGNGMKGSFQYMEHRYQVADIAAHQELEEVMTPGFNDEAEENFIDANNLWEYEWDLVLQFQHKDCDCIRPEYRIEDFNKVIEEREWLSAA